MRGVILTGIVAAVLVGAVVWRVQAVSRSRLSDEAVVCEAIVKKVLKAPSTYKRISVTSGHQDPGSFVYLTFDASNPMGVALRSTASCAFAEGKGSADDRLTDATFDGEPIATGSMLTILKTAAFLELMRVRDHERTIGGKLGF